MIFDNADPEGFVQFAKKYVQKANQVWCVFDIDYIYKDKRLLKALEAAKNTEINIAYSNVAFEVWLISHFEKCDRPLQINDYDKIINKYLKQYNKQYSKVDKKLLKEYFIPVYKQAIINSKIVYQSLVRDYRLKHSESTQFPIWNWNSSTTVYKLVEALLLKN